MRWLYLALDVGSVLFPLAFSFHPRIKFHRTWAYLLPSLAVMMAVFIPWDTVFTEQGVWGFSAKYTTGLFVGQLPAEEWLFFILIPYACTFIHHALSSLCPSVRLPLKTAICLVVGLCLMLIVLAARHSDLKYTFFVSLYTLLITVFSVLYRPAIFQSFLVSYCIMLVPFLLVNGILTGTWLEEPVVWYNNNENLGLRIGTIPVEDTLYNFGMILTVLIASEVLKKRIHYPTPAPHESI